MANRPQTLYGIEDSPVGLAAWILDHDASSEALMARVFDGQSEGLTRAAAARAVASADPDLRSLALAALGRQSSPAAVIALVTLTGDAKLAGDAMQALARSSARTATAAIERLAASPATRRLAARDVQPEERGAVLTLEGDDMAACVHHHTGQRLHAGVLGLGEGGRDDGVGLVQADAEIAHKRGLSISSRIQTG